jgi:hypothetical protein
MAAAAGGAPAAVPPAAPEIVKGALSLDPDVWRERAAMNAAAAACARCALSGEEVRPPLAAPQAALAEAELDDDDAAAPAGEAPPAAAPAAPCGQVDHVVECWLLSTLVDYALREMAPSVRKAARRAAGGSKATLRKSFLTDGPNARLFLVLKTVANSTLNLAVLHPAAHAAKTAFFQNDVRPAVLGALRASVKRDAAPTFPSFFTIRMGLVAEGKKAPVEAHVRLWAILYSTFAYEVWQLAQMVPGGLHEEDLRTAFFVAQRLNALGAGPGGDVFALPDIRHLGQLARAAKRKETDDPQKLGPEGTHTADGDAPAGGSGDEGSEEEEEEE